MDEDGDGLPDIWAAWYGARGLSLEGDEDLDKVSNLEEAMLGTDPFDEESRLFLEFSTSQEGVLTLTWPKIGLRPSRLEGRPSLGVPGVWNLENVDPVEMDGEYRLELSPIDVSRFFRLQNEEVDTDGDMVVDWLEAVMGSSVSSANSLSNPRSYDTTGDGNVDTELTGDLAMFNEIYRPTESGARPTEAQAARFLMQATFGPRMEDVEHLVDIGIEAWVDEQIALPISYTSPYILAIKADFAATTKDPELSGYASNDTIVFGNNYMSAWAQSVIGGEDQLRQRIAWALSQILVASRSGAMLANQSQAIAHYYDQFLDEGFGNYEDLLNKVSRHPVMGRWLSSLGNQKADPEIGRYPDENYAREIMQLFSIGLWELNLDGTRKLDLDGEPIPTYGNDQITEIARVFTGIHYAGNSFGDGGRDDGFYMTTPMKLFPEEHDFGAKTLVDGTVIPEREATEANAIQDIEDAVATLVRHPNTAPFICRQLIQFTVTANPSPEYVERVASKFVDNGSGVVGDMEAVVRAIFLDPEARNPMEHLQTRYFGFLREPTVRTMHCARVMNLGRFENLMWWDWGGYNGDSLQEPMNAPSVFNYYRPDFRMRGPLADEGLDSPVFGIVSSYSAISYPNRLWTYCTQGFRQNGYDFPPDWSDLTAIAEDVSVLMDRVNLLFCAGGMSAASRRIITESVASIESLNERVQLAVFLALSCPEGACIK